MAYSAIAVANYFIKRSIDEHNPLTDMQVQKLVYFAHSVYFKFQGRPLVNDPFIAMQHGPMVTSLYNRLKKYGARPITEEIEIPYERKKLFSVEWELAIPEINWDDKEAVDTLDQVWTTLKHRTAAELRNISHSKEGAWYKTLKDKGCIDDNDCLLRIPRNLTILDEDIQALGR